jgi:hypothetical protein
MICISNVSYAESSRTDLTQIMNGLLENQSYKGRSSQSTFDFSQLWRGFDGLVAGVSGWLSGVSSSATQLLASPPQDPAPPFAFNGAYVGYSLQVGGYGNQSFGLGYQYFIENVNPQAQTFSVTFGFTLSGLNGSTFPSFNQTSSATFANPSPFPAVSTADLALLNQGRIPPDMPAQTVLPSQTIAVPAGTFLADEVRLQSSSYSYGGITESSNSTVWYDMSSGVLVEASNVIATQYSQTPENEVLQSTNIPMSSTSSVSTTTISTTSSSTTCPPYSAPVSGQTAFFDDFSQDAVNPNLPSVNTALWSVNSPVLSQIASKESAAFGENIGIGGLGLPVKYSQCGIDWSVGGDQMLSGLTTQAAFTPPFSIHVVATPNPAGMPGEEGGNPTALFLSNGDSSVLVAVYLGTSQVCVDSQGKAPICGSQVNPNEQYSIHFDVTPSQVVVTVAGSNGETPYVFTSQIAAGPNLALYLSIGTFAGEVPGETSYPSYTDSSIFSNVEIESSFARTLTTTVDTSFGGSISPSSGALVNVTNSVLAKSYTQYTNAAGQAVFQGLVTGTYVITASQTDSGLGTFDNSEAIVVGNPANPSETNTATILSIAVPSIQPLNISIDTTSPGLGLSPLSVNVSAAPYGWVGNYVVTWFVDGVEQKTSSGSPLGGDMVTLDFQSSKQETSYQIWAVVSSSGSWFGVPQETMQATSNQITVSVINSPYWANIFAVGSNLKVSLASSQTYNGEQGEVRFADGNVYLSAMVANTISGVTIPVWLQDIIGISYPWYGIDLSHVDSSGVNQISYTHTLEQLDSTAILVDAALPSGAPSSSASLEGYQFTLKLDPGSSWAELANFVVVTLGVIGIISALPPSTEEGLVGTLVSSLVQLITNEGSTLAVTLASGNPVDVLEQVENVGGQILQAFVQQVIPPLLISLGYSGLAESVVKRGIPLWAVADLGLDLGALIGAGIGADLGYSTEEFRIQSLTPSVVVNVDSHSPLAYVALSGATETVGWNGNWQGSPGTFDHSSVVNGTYSLAVPSGDYTLIVTSPPAVAQTDYTIGVNTNGHTTTVSGVVHAGSPQEYSITTMGGAVTITASKASSLSSITAELALAVGLIAVFVALGIILIRRQRFKSQPNVELR